MSEVFTEEGVYSGFAHIVHLLLKFNSLSFMVVF